MSGASRTGEKAPAWTPRTAHPPKGRVTSKSKAAPIPAGLDLNVGHPPEFRAKLLLEVHRRLVQAHGAVPYAPRREPMHELISTILSQRTSQRDEDLAYHELRELGSWADIEAAPVEAVAQAIRRSNYAEQKAPRIQATLRAIREAHGDYTLDFLRDLSPKEGLKWLTDLPGVGVKTASLVLLFCFGKPVFPVDTHVHRVTTRVGVIPKMGEAAAHKALLALLPPEPPLLFELHIDLLRHGQRICTFAAPKCQKCVLQDLCDAYAIYGDAVPPGDG